MSLVLASINRKGGVAKTTTAVNLAHGLARKLAENEGGNVIIVELDPQGDVSRALGIDPNDKCVSKVLTGHVALRDSIVSANRESEGGPSRANLYVLPASERLKRAKKYLIAQTALASVNFALDDEASIPIDDLLVYHLSPLRAAFKFIIIDCPPSLDLLETAVYKFADQAVVPVKVDYHGAAATANHTHNILAEQESGIDIKIGAVVPTFVRSRQKLARQMLKSLEQRYGKDIVSDPIPGTVIVEQSPARGGLTLFESAPDSEPTAAYQSLVNKFYKEGK
ncbi:MAG: ParA family protein [Candidatus Promineifilaceae bacterium]